MFQGSRLREAREARGLTGAALAELVGIRAASISHYENGHHAPAEEVREQLAGALNVRPSLFLRAPTLPDDRLIFWRSAKSATKLHRSRIVSKFNWLREITDVIERYVGFPDVDLPNAGLPGNPELISDDDIEALAVRVREEWDLGKEPIYGLVMHLENHGAVVVRTHMDSQHLDAFSQWRRRDGRPFIILGADKDSEARSLHDVAHEFGHMLIHREVAIQDFNKKSVHSLMEKQAYRFASALLLPADAFADDLYSTTLEAFRELKHKWRVAISAMIYRAKDLELISEDRAKQLWINMARRKWRTREPGDGDSPPEQPMLIRQAFDMILDRGMLDPAMLELELGIKLSDIEGITGLPEGYLRNDRRAPLKFRLAE